MLALLLAGAFAARGQMPEIRPINDFRVPEFDANGEKKSEVLGDTAEFLPDGNIKITGLRIVIFKGGVAEGALTSAQCTFDRRERKAFSNSEVRIERGDMVVTGKGFRWSAADQRIEILNRVCVELKGIKVWPKKETK